MKSKLLACIVVASLIMTMAVGCTTKTTSTTTTTTTVSTTPQPATFVFTDSLGRKVTVPTNITKVALSGPLAQIVLFAICPDKIVGVSSKWDASAAQFLDPKYYNLPNRGQL